MRNKPDFFGKTNNGLLKSMVVICLGGLILLSACSYTHLGSGGLSQGFSLVPGNLNEVWNQHTILIAGQSGGMGRSPMMMPGAYPRGEPGEQRGGSGMFELIVRATLMDSAVIESGLDEFAWLASLSAEEKEEYAARYDEEHYSGKYLFIWAEIMTPFSDQYLKLDRWTFFLQTESGEQLEPEKMVEQEVPRRNFSPGLPADSIYNSSLGTPFGSRSLPYKIVEFYFSLKGYHGVPLLSPEVKKLKFVVVRRDRKEDRAENAWNLVELRRKK